MCIRDRPDVVVQAASALLFGTEVPLGTMWALLRGFGVPEVLLEEGRGSDLSLAELGLGIQTLTGLAADPENSDNAAEIALGAADEETFANIRDFMQLAPWLYCLVPAILSLMASQPKSASIMPNTTFAAVARALRQSDYRLLHFVQMVRRAQIKGDHGRGAGAFARVVLRPARRLFLFISHDAETQALLSEGIVHLGNERLLSLDAIFDIIRAKQNDPVLRKIARQLIRTTWRYGLSDLRKLFTQTRPANMGDGRGAVGSQNSSSRSP